ncbi:MAG: hypothetical protein J6M56_07975, partial [Clostridia bacterium]|nr:hypothetical protein [Clostridia bacterium]
MNRKTKWSIMAAALALVLAACAVVFLAQRERELPVQQGNLLENGDFSAVTGGMPDHWNTGMWVTNAGASYLEAAMAADGTTAALVENVAANDARFEQTVSVRENATYRLTARVLAEDCDPEQLGANVSFLGVYGTSEDVHDTDGAWQTLTLYAHTGKGQKEATVCVRLGGYGSEATGRAWFTDVSLEQVEEAPVGAFVLDLSTPAPQKETNKAEGGKDTVIPGLLAVAAAYLIAAVVIARTLLIGGRMDDRRGYAALAGLLLAALLLRVALSACVAGYGVDMGCFGAWAARMAAVGPANFYEEGYFCDYPPAYLLVLGALGGLANLLGISFGTMNGEMLLKTVPIFCDLLLALAVFLATDRVMGRRPALGMAALIALNPAYIVAGACWGQIDSVLAVLLVALLLLARQGKWQAAIPVFALAVLAKPQAGLLAPLGVAALVRDAVKEKTARKPIFWGLLGGVIVTAAIVLPFSGNQASPLWIVDKYVETLSSYAYATLSTGNLMFLLGGNWTPNSQAVLGPITYGQMGMALMVLSFAFGIVVYLRGQGRRRLLLASAATMQLVFVLGSKMHERYILPALALLLLSFIETGDVRLLASAVLASATAAVNIGVVLAFEHLIAPNLWLGYVLGVVQLIAAGLTVWAAVCLSLGRAPMRLPARKARPVSDAHGEAVGGGEGAPSASEACMREELLHAKDYRLHLTKTDAL